MKRKKNHLNISLSHRLCSLAGFPWHNAGFLGKCLLASAFWVSSLSPCCSYAHRHTNYYNLTNFKIPWTTSRICCCILSLYISLSTMSNYHGLSLSTPPSSCLMPSKQQLPVQKSLLFFPILLSRSSDRLSKPYLSKEQVVPFPAMMLFSF